MSHRDIEVDPTKVKVIIKMLTPKNLRKIYVLQ